MAPADERTFRISDKGDDATVGVQPLHARS
jgi:hypothetical protein